MRYKIIVGDHNTRVKESTEQEQFPVEVHVHPGYRHAPYYENDIALVKLNQSVNLSPYVRTVCLPMTSEDLAKPARCADPGVPDNGFLINSSSISAFTHGILITFGCNDFYTLGEPAMPPPCTDPGVPDGGVRYDNSFNHNDRVRFACKSGWTIQGAGMIWCNKGVWSKPAPKCMGTNMATMTSRGSWYKQEKLMRNALLSGTNMATMTSRGWWYKQEKLMRNALLSGTNMATMTSRGWWYKQEKLMRNALLSGTNMATMTSRGWWYKQEKLMMNALLSESNMAAMTSHENQQ
ncbi:hypothetical protein QZH41_005006 [Actinostola sp. cb2023]|nr:hypothetical protein QZH41_005006 [Actinostola sp. cb2023]